MEETLKLSQENIYALRKFGIDVIPNNRNYWFLRTQAGTYYDDFLSENFIGIEWDKISNLEEIKNNSIENISNLVSEHYPKVDKNTYVAGQIKTFVAWMKKDDIVMIPNERSKIISFGIIEENEPYVYEPDEFELFLDRMDKNAFEQDMEIPDERPILKKRRKVSWLKHIERNSLDPFLYRIIYSHNAIVHAKDYELYIDRALSQFYIKDEEAFFTFKVNKKSNIPYSNMLNFLNNISSLVEYINNYQELEKIDLNDLVIKMGVQSKGIIQIKGGITIVLIIGMVIVGLFGGKISYKQDENETTFEMGTEGLPTLLNTISKLIDASDGKQKEDLEKIEDSLKKDLNDLELSLDND